MSYKDSFDNILKIMESKLINVNNEEYEDINEDNIENIIKDFKVKSKDKYEDYNFEEEELEEDDFYYEDLD